MRPASGMALTAQGRWSGSQQSAVPSPVHLSVPVPVPGAGRYICTCTYLCGESCVSVERDPTLDTCTPWILHIYMCICMQIPQSTSGLSDKHWECSFPRLFTLGGPPLWEGPLYCMSASACVSLISCGHWRGSVGFRSGETSGQCFLGQVVGKLA